MYIYKSTPDGKVRYSIRDTMNDEGRSTGKPRIIAWFDTLEDAAMVFRYLRGANMPMDDQNIALNLIQKWDSREWNENNANAETAQSTASVTDTTN